jgi:hypothetical protein
VVERNKLTKVYKPHNEGNKLISVLHKDDLIKNGSSDIFFRTKDESLFIKSGNTIAQYKY